MNQRNNDYKDIQNLFDAAFSDETDPQTERIMRGRLAEFRERFERSEKRSAWFGRVSWAGGATLAALVVITAYLVLLQPTGERVYAAAAKALQAVNTVHIAGSSNGLSTFIGVYASDVDDASKPFEIEAWEWLDEDGLFHSYKTGGPFVIHEDSDRRYEYNRDADTLWIKKTDIKLLNKVSVASMQLLESLKKYNIKNSDLGERTIGDRICKGMLTEKDVRRKEYWFDKKTNLPMELTFFRNENGEWNRTTFIQFDYDRPVPKAIQTYIGPKNPKQTHYDWDIAPRFDAWRKRLRELALRYRTEDFPNPMELIPRTSDETIQAYSYGKLPGVREYVVHPIQSSLGDFLRRANYHGTIRVPEEYQDIQLNHDLVLQRDVTMPKQIEFVLNAYDLEIVETQAERSVWIARYDGRSLKSWKEVKAPVSREGARALHPGMASGSNPVAPIDLFNDFNYYQDYDLKAQGVYIIDETGLPQPPDANADRKPYAVCSENVYWGGEESKQIAREWFEKEFGITFTEETRLMKTFVVQKR